MPMLGADQYLVVLPPDASASSSSATSASASASASASGSSASAGGGGGRRRGRSSRAGSAVTADPIRITDSGGGGQFDVPHLMSMPSDDEGGMAESDEADDGLGGLPCGGYDAGGFPPTRRGGGRFDDECENFEVLLRRQVEEAEFVDDSSVSVVFYNHGDGGGSENDDDDQDEDDQDDDDDDDEDDDDMEGSEGVHPLKRTQPLPSAGRAASKKRPPKAKAKPKHGHHRTPSDIKRWLAKLGRNGSADADANDDDTDAPVMLTMDLDDTVDAEDQPHNLTPSVAGTKIFTTKTMAAADEMARPKPRAAAAVARSDSDSIPPLGVGSAQSSAHGSAPKGWQGGGGQGKRRLTSTSASSVSSRGSSQQSRDRGSFQGILRNSNWRQQRSGSDVSLDSGSIHARPHRTAFRRLQDKMLHGKRGGGGMPSDVRIVQGRGDALAAGGGPSDRHRHRRLASANDCQPIKEVESELSSPVHHRRVVSFETATLPSAGSSRRRDTFRSAFDCIDEGRETPRGGTGTACGNVGESERTIQHRNTDSSSKGSGSKGGGDSKGGWMWDKVKGKGKGKGHRHRRSLSNDFAVLPSRPDKPPKATPKGHRHRRSVSHESPMAPSHHWVHSQSSVDLGPVASTIDLHQTEPDLDPALRPILDTGKTTRRSMLHKSGISPRTAAFLAEEDSPTVLDMCRSMERKKRERHQKRDRPHMPEIFTSSDAASGAVVDSGDPLLRPRHSWHKKDRKDRYGGGDDHSSGRGKSSSSSSMGSSVDKQHAKDGRRDRQERTGSASSSGTTHSGGSGSGTRSGSSGSASGDSDRSGRRPRQQQQWEARTFDFSGLHIVGSGAGVGIASADLAGPKSDALTPVSEEGSAAAAAATAAVFRGAAAAAAVRSPPSPCPGAVEASFSSSTADTRRGGGAVGGGVGGAGVGSSVGVGIPLPHPRRGTTRGVAPPPAPAAAVSPGTAVPGKTPTSASTCTSSTAATAETAHRVVSPLSSELNKAAAAVWGEGGHHAHRRGRGQSPARGTSSDSGGTTEAGCQCVIL